MEEKKTWSAGRAPQEEQRGDDMQSTVDAFEKQHSVPQIYRDRLGRYQFMPVRMGLKDCCGFMCSITGRSVKRN